MNSCRIISKKFRRHLGNFLYKLWLSRNRVPLLAFPIPCRLAYGGWFLSYPDEMGFNVLPLPRQHSYEEGEWRFLSLFIRPGMVCFDVGANQGFYTILLSKLVGPQGKVFAFEPVPSEFQKLERNTKLNRCSNVVLEKTGIGLFEGFADMFICLDGHGSRSSFAPPPEEVNASTKVEKVPVVALDSYVVRNNIKEIHFIKIDVEGSERDVLKGAKEVLKELRPLLMIEMADVATEQFGYQSVENYRYLESCDFVLFEVTIKGSLKPAMPKDSYRENLIAVPKEKIHQISNFMEEL